MIRPNRDQKKDIALSHDAISGVIKRQHRAAINSTRDGVGGQGGSALVKSTLNYRRNERLLRAVINGQKKGILPLGNFTPCLMQAF